MVNGINGNKSNAVFLYRYAVFSEYNERACRLPWFYQIGPNVEIFYHFFGLEQFKPQYNNFSDSGTKNSCTLQKNRTDIMV